PHHLRAQCEPQYDNTTFPHTNIPAISECRLIGRANNATAVFHQSNNVPVPHVAYNEMPQCKVASFRYPDIAAIGHCRIEATSPCADRAFARCAMFILLYVVTHELRH
ncbi:hypothetical protein, partial [Neisseria gonorrhoeae]|uniref:hypothetical protein n=1 Tax=Neisseria gonorrhoeae TaxID=485 RepID=UPI001C998323